MKFSHIVSDASLSIDLIYSSDEKSFTCDPWPFSNFSLLIGAGYVSLDFSLSNRRLVSLSGLSPEKTWKKSDFIIPSNIVTGEVYITDNISYEPGTGITYANWQPLYNPITKWIYLGDLNESDQQTVFVQFINQCVAVLHKDTLTGLYLNPIWL